jgi:hypothetical protein
LHRRQFRRIPPIHTEPTDFNRMYSVPKSQVLELIAGNHCLLVDAVENLASGPDFESW